MKKILLSSLACASLVLAANSDYKYEITPLIGGGLGEGNHSLERNYIPNHATLNSRRQRCQTR